MRMEEWTPEIRAFAEDASARSDYFERLAEIVLRGLPAGSRVCDAGCGMGQLAFAMARRGMRVHAVDRSSEAVRYVRSRLGRSGHGKNDGAEFEVEQCDFLDFDTHIGLDATAEPLGSRPGQVGRFDRMVFSLSASAKDAFAATRAARARSLVVVNKIHGTPNADDAGRPIVYNLEDAVGDLCSLGLITYATDVTLDLNQPFRSLEAAQAYYRLFRTRAYPGGVDTRTLLTELQATDDPEFPYLLPVRRHLAVFRISMARPQLCGEELGVSNVFDAFFSHQGGRQRVRAPRETRRVAC